MIPYDHWVLDNFFPVDVARRLANEFPDYNEPNWHWYNNPLVGMSFHLLPIRYLHI